MYGLWLTIKGKVLADSFVLRAREPDTFWVGSYFSPAAVIRERLEAFVIADDVTIDDETMAWAGVSLFGGVAPPAAEATVIFSGRRTRGTGAELVFPARSEAEVSPGWAGRTELDVVELERWRIAEAIPAVPADAGPGDLPNEAGLDAEAISYVKGCYLGQEVMARLKSMGQVRRRLLRVRGEGGALPSMLPSPLFAGGGRQVGELRSATDDGAGSWIGLAMLSLLHLPSSGSMLAFAPGGPGQVQLIDTP